MMLMHYRIHVEVHPIRSEQGKSEDCPVQANIEIHYIETHEGLIKYQRNTVDNVGVLWGITDQRYHLKGVSIPHSGEECM